MPTGVLLCSNINSFFRGICSKAKEFPPMKRVLLIKKRSRYALERAQRPGITDKQLIQLLSKQGTDVETLVQTHHLHMKNTDDILNSFTEAGFQVHMADRTLFTDESVEWADLVVAAGGDGTFLMCASRIKSKDKPIIGFNTDPKRSTGYLCVNGKHSNNNCYAAVQRIKNNEFSWLFRTRIEVKLTGPRANEEAVELDQSPQPVSPGITVPKNVDEVNMVSRVLPFLALNEVFIGESLSSQVSYFVMDVPGVQKTKVKCSGLCVSTGTGSTSWHMSINRLSLAKVHRLLQIAGVEKSPKEIKEITKKFNRSLKFAPDDPRLFYTLRDLICAGVWPDPPGLPSDSFTPSVCVASKCFAANLVLDGSRAYAFNDGTVAELTSRPENMLRTVCMP